MATTDTQKPKSILVILRRVYLEIVEGNHCAAKLIEYFKHWRDWKLKVHRTEWIYMPLKWIHEDLMGEHSLHVIRAAIAQLSKSGILERRKNPGNGQDKTWQYKLNLAVVQGLVQKKSREFKNESSQFNVEQHTHDLTPVIPSTTNNSVVESELILEEENTATRELPNVKTESSTPPPEITQESSTQVTTEEIRAIETRLRNLGVQLNPTIRKIIIAYFANVENAIAHMKERLGFGETFKSAAAVFVKACKEGALPEKPSSSSFPQEEFPPDAEQMDLLNEAKALGAIHDYYLSGNGITKVVIKAPFGNVMVPWYEFLKVSPSARETRTSGRG